MEKLEKAWLREDFHLETYPRYWEDVFSSDGKIEENGSISMLNSALTHNVKGVKFQVSRHGIWLRVEIWSVLGIQGA